MARRMEFNWHNGGEDGKHTGVGLWRYPKYLKQRTRFSFKHSHLTELYRRRKSRGQVHVTTLWNACFIGKTNVWYKVCQMSAWWIKKCLPLWTFWIVQNAIRMYFVNKAALNEARFSLLKRLSTKLPYLSSVLHLKQRWLAQEYDTCSNILDSCANACNQNHLMASCKTDNGFVDWQILPSSASQ